MVIIRVCTPQHPGASEWRENDTAPVQLGERWVECYGPSCSEFVDVNPLFGRVAYLRGLAVDQPLAVTRVNYAADKWNVNLYGFANGDPINFSDPFGAVRALVHGGCRRCRIPLSANMGETPTGSSLV